MPGPKDISFDCSEQDKQEPAEGKTHMHISKPQVGFKYFPVNQTLKEYLFKALPESFPEKSALKPEFICSGQVAEPAYASDYCINEDEVESYIKRYDKGIKLHLSPVY